MRYSVLRTFGCVGQLFLAFSILKLVCLLSLDINLPERIPIDMEVLGWKILNMQRNFPSSSKYPRSLSWISRWPPPGVHRVVSAGGNNNTIVSGPMMFEHMYNGVWPSIFFSNPVSKECQRPEALAHLYIKFLTFYDEQKQTWIFHRKPIQSSLQSSFVNSSACFELSNTRDSCNTLLVIRAFVAENGASDGIIWICQPYAQENCSADRIFVLLANWPIPRHVLWERVTLVLVLGAAEKSRISIITILKI